MRAGTRSPQGFLAGCVALFALSLLGTAQADAKRLDMRIDERGSKVSATFTPKRRPIEYSIRLNGGHVEDVFAGAAPSGRKVVLSLREGLKFGRNVLRVRALYHDGKVVKVVRRFEVDDRRPLVGIGGVRRSHEGVRLKLRAREKRGVRFTWKLLKRPDDAKAKLAGSHAERPRFRPDAPGVYRVALTAQSAAGAKRTAVAHLLVESQDATKAGVFVGLEPLDTTTQGNPTALRIFGGSSEGSYPIGPQNGQSGPIVNLIFDRCTLTQIGDPIYMNTSQGDVGSLGTAVRQAQQGLANSGCSILVLTAGAGYGQIGSLGPPLDNWTGHEEEIFYSGMTAPFWAIWSPPPLGSKPSVLGKGWTNLPPFDGTSPAGRMAGELVPDPEGNYSFRQSTAPAFGEQNTQLRFHMDQSGITLPQQGGGPGTFSADTPGCPQNGNGGFQLVVVAASGQYVLDLIQIGTAQVNGQSVGNGDTFWVNGCTPAEGEAWAQALAKVLASVGTNYNDYPTMIFLQGVGNALPPASEMTADQRLALAETASIIGNMGGSAGAFLNNEAATSGPGYSFAGQSWPLPGGARSGTEVSSSTPGAPPAQLDGYIKPDLLSRLAPSTATSSGEVLGPDLENYRAPETASAIVNLEGDFVPTPFPGAGEPEWQSAMYYLAKSVFVPVLKYDGTDACYAPSMDSNGVVKDIRSMYCGGGSGSNTCDYPWSTYAQLMSDAAYVAGNGFDEATWTAVTTQLQREFAMVENLNCSVGAYQVAYGNQAAAGDLDVSEMVDDTNIYIKKEIAKSQIWPIVGDSLEVIASLANVIAVVYSFRENYTGSNVAWGIQGVIDLATSITTLGFEIDSVLAPMPANTTATAYASMLEGGLQSASAALNTPRDQIASDWTRLQAFDQAGLDLQKGDVRAAETALAYATYDRIWKQLLPSGFVPSHLLVNSSTGDPPPIDPPNYECVNDPSNNLPGETQPFATFTPNTYTLYPEGATATNPTGLEAYVLAGTYYSGSFGDHFYQPIQAPDKEVLSQLFSPIANPNASNPSPIANNQATPLGVNKEQFFADVIESAKAAKPSQIFEVGSNQGFCPYP